MVSIAKTSKMSKVIKLVLIAKYLVRFLTIANILKSRLIGDTRHSASREPKNELLGSVAE